jgi:hypothetical protein
VDLVERTSFGLRGDTAGVLHLNLEQFHGCRDDNLTRARQPARHHLPDYRQSAANYVQIHRLIFRPFIYLFTGLYCKQYPHYH